MLEYIHLKNVGPARDDCRDDWERDDPVGDDRDALRPRALTVKLVARGALGLLRRT